MTARESSHSLLPADAPRVLVIEDDPHFREAVEQVLESADIAACVCESPEEGLRQIAQFGPQVVLTDLYLGEGTELTGLDVLSRVRAEDAAMPVVLMTARGTVPKAVEAIHAGAYDFLEKPFQKDMLLAVLGRAVQQQRLASENRKLKEQLAFASGLERILVGDSTGMRQLRDGVLRIAPTPANVIILGETGAGKEMVARCLHEFSGRQGNFVAINCAAVPETLFESELFGHEAGAFTGASKLRIGKVEHANGGTLFLDEIEAMPLHLQAKILRVLQERQVERLGSNKLIPVDLRVVAATKTDLKKLSLENKFRLDLYFRLNVAGVRIPPLRERLEDIPLLLTHFLHEAALRFGQKPVTPTREVQRRLLMHDWLGNVRELRNAAEQLQLGIPLSIGNEAQPAAERSLDEIVGSLERAVLDETLRRHGGFANGVCQELQINNSTLYRKMKAYGMDLSHYRPGGSNAAAG
jgi:DNA-binding NtrC family response regulator